MGFLRSFAPFGGDPGEAESGRGELGILNFE
jgi:hypothetical protein